MIDARTRQFLKLLLVLFCSTTFIYSQASWGITTLAGYNFNSGSDLVKRNNFLLSLDGEFEYTFKMENREASFLIRAKPETYSLPNDLKTLRLKGRVNYHQKEERYTWGVNLVRLYHIYDGKNFNLNYDIFILSADATCFFIPDNPFTINFGYTYQTTKDGFEQNLDFLFIDGKLFTQFDYFKLGYGFYLERFGVDYEQLQPFDFKDSNNGWRIGPQVVLNYLKNWIFRVEYRFLIHQSPLTESTSYDQWIRLLAGKIIFNDLSAFILVDYYSRNYKLNGSASEVFPLLYSPIDQENNLYLKIEYDLNDLFSVYVRSGYSKENFFVNDLSFSGWNVLLGLSIGN